MPLTNITFGKNKVLNIEILDSRIIFSSDFHLCSINIIDLTKLISTAYKVHREMCRSKKSKVSTDKFVVVKYDKIIQFISNDNKFNTFSILQSEFGSFIGFIKQLKLDINYMYNA